MEDVAGLSQMTLDTLYSNINTTGREAILNRQEKTDPFLNDLGQDQRFGLSLLVPIHGPLIEKFGFLIAQLQQIEPTQYYYPIADLHVTVITLVSAHDAFIKDGILINKLLDLIQNAILGIGPFEIHFKGIIPSNEAVLVKGYYHDGLKVIRDRIRKNASEYGIELKERYQSISAHSTMVRFKSIFQNREKFLAAIEKYSEFDLGSFQVHEMKLVIHDWYNHRKEEVGNFLIE